MIGNVILFNRDVRASRRRFSIDLSSSVNLLMMWNGWSTDGVVGVLAVIFAYVESI